MADKRAAIGSREVRGFALDAIADELNERPRKTLDWMTSSEKFTELAATID